MQALLENTFAGTMPEVVSRYVDATWRSSIRYSSFDHLISSYSRNLTSSNMWSTLDAPIPTHLSKA